MAQITFDCSHCGQHLEADADVGGQSVICPSCDAEARVPPRTAPAVARVARVAQASTPDASPPEPDEERELFSLRPTARAFLGQIVLGILLLPVLVGIGLLINVWYKVASLRYRLTSQRLFIQKGLIAKHLEEVEVFRIKDVTLRQTFLQRLLGFGTIVVLSSDDTNPELVMIGINQPVDVKEMIRNTFRAARRREGVRIAEFMPS